MAALANSAWLDGVWLVLVVAAGAGSVWCAAGFVAHWLFGDVSPRALKWFWRVAHAQFVVVLAWAVAGRCLSEVHTCFADFLRDGGATSFTRALAFAWISGVALFVVGDFVRVLAVYRRARGWSSVEDAAVRAVARRVGVRGSFDVRVCADASSPFVFGFCKPVLVLPSRAMPLTGTQREAVLAHEMAHVRDRDSLFAVLELVFRRLLFFHPAVYFAAADYELAQEKSADQRALDALPISRADYARGFMNLIEWNFNGRGAEGRGGGVAWPASGAVSSFRALRARLLFIDGYQRGGRVQAWRVILPAAVLCASGWSTAQPAHQGHVGVGVGMCIQVQHEKFFEQLLHIETETKTCEPSEAK